MNTLELPIFTDIICLTNLTNDIGIDRRYLSSNHRKDRVKRPVHHRADEHIETTIRTHEGFVGGFFDGVYLEEKLTGFTGEISPRFHAKYGFTHLTFRYKSLG